MQKFFAHFMYYTHTYVPTIPTSLYSLLIHFNGQNLTNIKQKPRKTYIKVMHLWFLHHWVKYPQAKHDLVEKPLLASTVVLIQDFLVCGPCIASSVRGSCCIALAEKQPQSIIFPPPPLTAPMVSVVLFHKAMPSLFLVSTLVETQTNTH